VLRQLPALLLAASAAFAPLTSDAQVSAATRELALYGVNLKGTTLGTFTAAASKAGATSQTWWTNGGYPTYSVENVGVPGLQSFAVVHDAGRVLSVQFLVKTEPSEDNEALRALLVHKYGEPAAAVRSRVIGRKFTGAGSPDGVYEWQFLRGMKLTYTQRPDGSAPTLTYTDTGSLEAFAQRVKIEAAKVALAEAEGLLNGIAEGY
jgi:hypothetical protein